jgi:hypothetical protein
MADKRQNEKSEDHRSAQSAAAGKPYGSAQADERVRQGYEQAAHPEQQGDGDPSPLNATKPAQDTPGTAPSSDSAAAQGDGDPSPRDITES